MTQSLEKKNFFSTFTFVRDRLYDKALYEAAKIIFAFISNWAKLAVTLVKLK